MSPLESAPVRQQPHNQVVVLPAHCCCQRKPLEDPVRYHPSSLTLIPPATAASADGRSPSEHVVTRRSASDGEAPDDKTGGCSEGDTRQGWAMETAAPSWHVFWPVRQHGQSVSEVCIRRTPTYAQAHRGADWNTHEDEAHTTMAVQVRVVCVGDEHLTASEAV